jgi:hypothetical protein
MPNVFRVARVNDQTLFKVFEHMRTSFADAHVEITNLGGENWTSLVEDGAEPQEKPLRRLLVRSKARLVGVVVILRHDRLLLAG